MEIRELREEDDEAAAYVWSQAFREGGRDTNRRSRSDQIPRVSFGVWDAAGLEAVASILEYRIHLGADAVVPMGGIAAVACLPASRGKGYAAVCLKRTLEQMRNAGQAVSALFPFSFDYYDRLGWAWSGVSRTYEVPTRILRPDPETERVRAATDADRPAIVAAYTEFARRYRGPVVRGDTMWDGMLASTEEKFRFTYLYENEGNVEGYLTYLGGKRDETRLREFVALTPRARRGLLGLLRRHEMQIDKFVWSAPSDDLLWTTLYHWDLKTRISPTTMGRIVDVPAALTAWKPNPAAQGAVILAVRDDSAPWNQGAWRVEFGGGEVHAASTGEAAQVGLDIRALSQAYFGTPSLRDLRAAGLVDVSDEGGFRALVGLLSGPPMWMNDSF